MSGTSYVSVEEQPGAPQCNTGSPPWRNGVTAGIVYFPGCSSIVGMPLHERSAWFVMVGSRTKNLAFRFSGSQVMSNTRPLASSTTECASTVTHPHLPGSSE
eukprot:1735781-Prymnesium_polylepis.1